MARNLTGIYPPHNLAGGTYRSLGKSKSIELGRRDLGVGKRLLDQGENPRLVVDGRLAGQEARARWRNKRMPHIGQNVALFIDNANADFVGRALETHNQNHPKYLVILIFMWPRPPNPEGGSDGAKKDAVMTCPFPLDASLPSPYIQDYTNYLLEFHPDAVNTVLLEVAFCFIFESTARVCQSVRDVD